jgi:hypothetical protein
MLDLIERLKKATGPDWELDHEIFAHVHGWSYPLHGAALHEFNESTREHGRTDYTASIDAALTLVEPRSAWAVSHSPDADPQGYPRPYRATVMPDLAYSGRRDSTDHHGHPAIALCIAALKARTEQRQKSVA